MVRGENITREPLARAYFRIQDSLVLVNCDEPVAAQTPVHKSSPLGIVLVCSREKGVARVLTTSERGQARGRIHPPARSSTPQPPNYYYDTTRMSPKKFPATAHLRQGDGSGQVVFVLLLLHTETDYTAASNTSTQNEASDGMSEYRAARMCWSTEYCQ